MSVHNITLDDADTSGVIKYTQPDDTGWADQTCSTCFAKPTDLSKVFDGTWHDTTYLPGQGPNLGIQFLFEGSAIYIYGIQVNSTSGIPVVNNSLIFTLDGQPAGNYTHTPNDPNYAYNVLFYGNSNLTQAPHNLTMNLNGTSSCLFDYMVYTTNSTSSSAVPAGFGAHKSTNHAGAIAGGVIGGFAGLVIIIVLIWALFFRSKQRRGVTMIPASPTSEPKTDDPEAGTQRPAVRILARLHGHETSSGVDPFTREEWQRREEAQVPLSGSKAAMMQRSPHLPLLSSGEAGGSRVGAPSSVDPPSSAPSSQVASPQQSRSQPSGVHSLTPSQSTFNIVPASETTVESNLGGSNRRPDSAEVARKPPLSLAPAEEEAPPAYGSAP